jgi:hypothetical protein
MVCRFFVGAVGAAFLAPLVGCTYLVDPGSLQPRPNVLLNASTQTLALDLPEAPEKVSVALPYHGHGLEIHGWRRGLADGFREAFKKYFRIVPASAAPDWTLNIVKAKPTLAPTSLGRHVTLVAEITFQATLMRAGALPRRSGRRSPRDARWSSWTPLNRSRAPSR